MSDAAVPDYYEILQVSARAHPMVITKAYRLLAALYHPDNRETGDEATFRQVMEAAHVLTDPARRAAYDGTRPGRVPGAGPLDFDDGRPPEGTAADPHECRLLLLESLCSVRRSRPSQPSLPLMVLPELLGCSMDEVQFTLWYLRGKKLVEPTDDGVAITVAGVDWLERHRPERESPGSELLSLGPAERMLEAF